MGRLSSLLIAFALSAASAVAFAACGGSDADLLPETSASEIESSLNEVAQLADEGDCIGAELAVADVVAKVEELREVDLRLKAALQEGAAKLSVAVGRCDEEEEEETEPAPESEVEGEEVEDEKKPKKEKPGKDNEESSEPEEEPGEGESPEPSPQSEGKGEEKGGGAQPAEPEVEETEPSGGVGPGVGVE